ncbi:hypothetical protein OKF32_06920 [Lentilactobacillus buchneri]|nr:hypothetical protein OKF32_06920 [Lentilactobacillus sp. Egmn17]
MASLLIPWWPPFLGNCSTQYFLTSLESFCGLLHPRLISQLNQTNQLSRTSRRNRTSQLSRTSRHNLTNQLSLISQRNLINQRNLISQRK